MLRLMHRSSRALLPVVVAGGMLAGTASAGAVSLPRASVRADDARARPCTTVLPAGPAVAHVRRTATRTGLLRARVTGTGDWDLAVFDRRTGRYLAGGAGPGADLAEGFAAAGQDLLVQACHFAGSAGAATITLANTGMAGGAGDGPTSVLAVQTPTRADKERLARLGLDPAEGATATTVDVVAHGARDLLALAAAGLRFSVRIPDLLALDRANRAADRRYAARVRRSALPSGRDGYRHLADYEAEMKLLAQANPGLVKLITLPHRSLLGREVLGLEIGRDVNVERGLPVFAQLGVHHAREWPAGEHPMEWAYELVRGNGRDPRITSIVRRERNVIVPVVNPDGFNLTREAPLDLGNALAAIDLPAGIDGSLPITDPTYTAALLLDQSAGTYAYKRRNCRVRDGSVPTAEECAAATNRTRGVDPNRNYGALWGGPGAGLAPEDDTYRGPAPFSEPEVQNVRELVSARQVTTLITNHTFSGLILRPPGVRAQGAPVDETALKALGDAMAAQNGYRSVPGYELYDTTGTTEDWSYAATGGFGFTFEIGKDEFHPPYAEVVREYAGPTELGGAGGNRGAYLLAAEWAAAAGNHSVLRGRAPVGTTLRLHKQFTTQSSPVIMDTDGTTGPSIGVTDTLESRLTVGRGGSFTWHTNPSTRPALARPTVTSDVADAPQVETDISAATPPPLGSPRLIRFTVPAGAARQLRITTAGNLPSDDIDINLYAGDVRPENQVGSSANGGSAELIVLDGPRTDVTYTLQIVNFAALGGYTGRIRMFGSLPGSERVTPAGRESYTLTCERRGRVLRRMKVRVARGQAKALGDVCRRPRVTRRPTSASARRPSATGTGRATR